MTKSKIKKNRNHIEILRKFYGRDKSIPCQFEVPALEALSHYPELRDVQIKFKLVKSLLPYYSRPTIWSILFPWTKREYLIGISIKTSDIRTGSLLENLSSQAQIGALGHELAHTLRYEKQRWYQIMLDGIRYFFLGFREEYEKGTDRLALDHGLGDEVIAWATEVYPIKSKEKSRLKVYYTPEELAELLNNT